MSSESKDNEGKAKEDLRFEVQVWIPAGSSLEAVQAKAIASGRMEPQALARLLAALSRTPRLRLYEDVERRKAEAARKHYSELGLAVSLIPHLSLHDMTEGDRTVQCPACHERVEPAPGQTCPRCRASLQRQLERLVRVDSKDETKAPPKVASKPTAQEEDPAPEEDEATPQANERRSVLSSRRAQAALASGVLLAMGLSFWAGQWRAEAAADIQMQALRRTCSGLGFEKMLERLSVHGAQDFMAPAAWSIDPADSLSVKTALKPLRGESPESLKELTGWLVLGGAVQHVRRGDRAAGRGRRGGGDRIGRQTDTAGPGPSAARDRLRANPGGRGAGSALA